jgi:hypothetical protein
LPTSSPPRQESGDPASLQAAPQELDERHVGHPPRQREPRHDDEAEPPRGHVATARSASSSAATITVLPPALCVDQQAEEIGGVGPSPDGAE